MNRTTTILLCLFCLIMATAISAAGYSNYQEYKADPNVSIGDDIQKGIDDTTTKIKNLSETGSNLQKWVFNLDERIEEMTKWIIEDIVNAFKTTWNNIKKFFNPSSDYDEEDEEEYSWGEGIGGGGGGARG